MFYIAATILVVIFLLMNQSTPNDNTKRDLLGKRDVDSRLSRINMDTYKEPQPCLNCPGENGASVSLTVS